MFLFHFEMNIFLFSQLEIMIDLFIMKFKFTAYNFLPFFFLHPNLIFTPLTKPKRFKRGKIK